MPVLEYTDDATYRILYDGLEMHFHCGLLHRDNAPAVITAVYVEWYRYGKLHRTDGPARVFLQTRIMEWYEDNRWLYTDVAEDDCYLQRHIKGWVV